MEYICIDNNRYVCFNELMPDDEFDEIIHGTEHQNICINSAIPAAEYEVLIDDGKNVVFNAKIKNIYDFVTAINIKKFEWKYGKLKVISEWQDTIRYTFSGCYYWIKNIELTRSKTTAKQCLSLLHRHRYKGIIELYFEDKDDFPFFKKSYDSSSSEEDENKPIEYSNNDTIYYIPRSGYFVSRYIVIYALKQLVINITNNRITKKILNQLRIWGFVRINALFTDDHTYFFITHNYTTILKKIQNKRLRHLAYDIFYGRKRKHNYIGKRRYKY